MNSWTARIAVTLAAIFCAFAAFRGGWVAFSLRRTIRGGQFVIGSYDAGAGKIALLSYGVVAAVLCLLGLVAFWRKRPFFLAWTSLGLLLLVLGAVLQVAFVNTSLLYDLVRDDRQYRDADKFSARNLPVNLGTTPTKRRSVSTNTLWDRMVAAQYFMSLGWYSTLTIGSLGLSRGMWLFPTRSRRWQFGMTAGVAVLALGVASLASPVRAQWALRRAVERESRGDFDKAVINYRRAMELDRWFEFDTSARKRIGAIDQNFGRTNTMDFGVYRVESMADSGDWVSAIAELEKLLRSDPPNRSTLRQRMGELWAIYGRNVYYNRAYGEAAMAWENAMTYDPQQLAAGFCLTSVYGDLGRYADSIALVTTLQSKITDPHLLSQLLSNQGDAYTKQGEFVNARMAYYRAYKLDTVNNWRALSALVGGN